MERCVKQDPCIMSVQGSCGGSSRCGRPGRQSWCRELLLVLVVCRMHPGAHSCAAAAMESATRAVHAEGWLPRRRPPGGGGGGAAAAPLPSESTSCLPAREHPGHGRHSNPFFPHARGLPAVTRPDSEQIPARLHRALQRAKLSTSLLASLSARV